MTPLQASEKLNEKKGTASLQYKREKHVPQHNL